LLLELPPQAPTSSAASATSGNAVDLSHRCHAIKSSFLPDNTRAFLRSDMVKRPD
jgi:hypothetical protein